MGKEIQEFVSGLKQHNQDVAINALKQFNETEWIILLVAYVYAFKQ